MKLECFPSSVYTEAFVSFSIGYQADSKFQLLEFRNPISVDPSMQFTIPSITLNAMFTSTLTNKYRPLENLVGESLAYCYQGIPTPTNLPDPSTPTPPPVPTPTPPGGPPPPPSTADY